MFDFRALPEPADDTLTVYERTELRRIYQQFRPVFPGHFPADSQFVVPHDVKLITKALGILLGEGHGQAG